MISKLHAKAESRDNAWTATHRFVYGPQRRASRAVPRPPTIAGPLRRWRKCFADLRSDAVRDLHAQRPPPSNRAVPRRRKRASNVMVEKTVEVNESKNVNANSSPPATPPTSNFAATFPKPIPRVVAFEKTAVEEDVFFRKIYDGRRVREMVSAARILRQAARGGATWGSRRRRGVA